MRVSPKMRGKLSCDSQVIGAKRKGNRTERVCLTCPLIHVTLNLRPAKSMPVAFVREFVDIGRELHGYTDGIG